ncbi:MAG: carbohydrate ABC transporter permease [Nitrososphaeria archaeon]
MVKIRRVIIYILAIIVGIWSIIPIYWFVNLSLMTEQEVATVPVHFWPHQPTLANYLRMLGFNATAAVGNQIVSFAASGYAPAIRLGLINSAIVATCITAITLAIAVPTGYAFGRYKFRGKNGLLFTLLMSRSLPAICIVLPFYILFQSLALLGTLQGLIIIYTSITIPLMTWILMGYFATLPIEVERAARVDGASRLSALRRVVIPMAAAGIGTVGVLTFLISWNEFLYAWIMNAGTPAQTLPPVFPAMLFQIIDNTGLAAATIISLIPVIIIALLFGRYITRLKIVDPVMATGG